jgi:hypothetical protein
VLLVDPSDNAALPSAREMSNCEMCQFDKMLVLVDRRCRSVCLAVVAAQPITRGATPIPSMSVAPAAVDRKDLALDLLALWSMDRP